ncbi:CDP-4-dehydro-6-deoxyglucose reductase [Bradyrhizobium sp. F1.4.3]|uniref:2Fe-2S iron-sulfur cluster-binding protein n=1 Tax=Bradyrhizobium sp. F1.4.3 TaxID=3156356 RepID=UPI00339B5A39
MRTVKAKLSSGRTFEARSDETILAAATRAGIWLPSACRAGSCGSCKARIVTGEFVHNGSIGGLGRTHDPLAALLCRASALTDITIDVLELSEPPASEKPPVPARAVALKRENENVIRVTLRFPPFDKPAFRPGQFVGIRHSDGMDRSFSIANAPRDDGTIELHIGRVAGGAFTGHVFEELKINDILQVSGPYGNFGYSSQDRPSIFVAGGTGIAPVRAILEALTRDDFRSKARVYWGSRTRSGFYIDRELRDLCPAGTGIEYVPVLSDPDESWKGRTGLVHEAVLQDFTDLSGFDVYACGSPATVDATYEALSARGARPDRFFADSFHRSGPTARQPIQSRKGLLHDQDQGSVRLSHQILQGHQSK